MIVYLSVSEWVNDIKKSFMDQIPSLGYEITSLFTNLVIHDVWTIHLIIYNVHYIVNIEHYVMVYRKTMVDQNTPSYLLATPLGFEPCSISTNRSCVVISGVVPPYLSHLSSAISYCVSTRKSLSHLVVDVFSPVQIAISFAYHSLIVYSFVIIFIYLPYKQI